jgi:LuxR family maltose regulon positive regulatory protein
MRPNPLLETKLYVPQAHPSLVPRLRLNKRLKEGLGRKMTLISAPAGFGKTTLLSEWRMIHSASEWRIGWVSLDEGDNDPARFFSYFVGAVKFLNPDIGEAPLASLQSSPPPPLESVLTLLINEITSIPQEFALVLDDYHVIKDQSIHHAVAFLLDHLPPQMHLVVASRTDPPLPLARLRAQGQLTELRAADLRFTPEETANFLGDAMGLTLSAGDIAALEERTEGWIAGLQLAALSMQGEQDIPNFIKEFTGSHRYVLDYLTEEVMHKQPEDIQSFLLRTGILDRLSGPVCDALTGGSDGQEKLESLEHANLFVVPLDNQRRWYRYHHLFSKFLRECLQRTQPDLASDLHCRASEWHEHNGLVTEAVGHALAAADFERAARLVDQNAEGILRGGRLNTLVGWIDALPERTVRLWPRPYLFHAESLFLLGRYTAAEASLQKVEQAIGEDSDDRERSSEGSTKAPLSSRERAELRSMVAAIRASIASVHGDLPRTIALSQQALQGLPDEASIWRGNTLTQLGAAYGLNGDVERASQTFAEAHRVNRSASNTYADRIVTWRSARLQMLQGRLHGAAETYQTVLQQATEQATIGQLPVTGYCHLDMGEILREWNDLDAATHHLVRGIERVKQAGSATILLDGYVALARLQQAKGDPGAALDTIQEAQGLADKLPPRFGGRLAAYRARLWFAQGRLEAAARWAHERGLNVDDELSYPREVEHLTLARVLVGQGRSEEALILLKRLLDAAEAGERTNSVIEILALRSLALQAQDATLRALDALGRSLALAESGGYVRTFLDEGAPMATLLANITKTYSRDRKASSSRVRGDYVDRLLAAFEQQPPLSQRTPPGVLPPIEPLSERELEVLGLVAAGLKNREIAEELFVVVGTVKAHVNSIYRKLATNNRVQAVSRARELGLL